MDMQRLIEAASQQAWSSCNEFLPVIHKIVEQGGKPANHGEELCIQAALSAVIGECLDRQRKGLLPVNKDFLSKMMLGSVDEELQKRKGEKIIIHAYNLKTSEQREQFIETMKMIEAEPHSDNRWTIDASHVIAVTKVLLMSGFENESGSDGVWKFEKVEHGHKSRL